MDNTKLHTAYVLTLPVVVLATLQSVGGLFLPALYRDIPLIVAAMKGNDVVTLFLVVPLLTWAATASRRGAQRARLVWMGCLGYVVYNYLYYLFGIAFNRFFLVYAATFICSFYAFIYGLSGIEIHEIAPKFKPETPVRWISGFLLFIGGILCIVEMSQILGFLWNAELPSSISQFGDPDAPAVIFAADMVFVIPAFALAGVWLWQRRSWGFLMAAIMLVKAFTYGAALIGMVLFGWTTLGTWDPLMPFYIFIATGGFVFLWVFLKNLEE